MIDRLTAWLNGNIEIIIFGFNPNYQHSGVLLYFTHPAIRLANLGRMASSLRRIRSLISRLRMGRWQFKPSNEHNSTSLVPIQVKSEDSGLIDVLWRRRPNFFIRSGNTMGPHYLVPSRSEMRQIQSLRSTFISEVSTDKNSSNSLWQRVKTWLTWKSVNSHSPRTVKHVPRQLGKKVVIIGSHGWIPSKFLQTVVGLPRGTSTRLCHMMETNLREFLDQNLPQPNKLFGSPTIPEIICFPLEGAGCIDERVELHYGVLKANETSLETIRTADTVIFVSHSQGAPVAALLAQRLMEEYPEPIIQPQRQNVLLLNLAAVFHGPFPELKSNLVVKYVEADAARELFDLNDPYGDLAVRLQKAITQLLREDALFCEVASWLDQVVPLYSALLLGFDHPNIWRCVYIDGHNYRPDFLTELIRFTLRLTNAGLEGARQLTCLLTEPLAGSLYQSNAHSTLYDDHEVYQVALNWLHTRPRTGNEEEATIHVSYDYMQWKENKNPYTMPWIMRSIFSTIQGLAHSSPLPARQILLEDWAILQNTLQEWKPEKKNLKELCLQMEPIRSKL